MPLITYRYCVCVACDTDIKMLPALLSIEPEKVYALPDHSLADDDFKLMATLSDLADRELVATIGWAKQVPGKPVCLESFSDCLSSFFHVCPCFCGQIVCRTIMSAVLFQFSPNFACGSAMW